MAVSRYALSPDLHLQPRPDQCADRAHIDNIAVQVVVTSYGDPAL